MWLQPYQQQAITSAAGIEKAAALRMARMARLLIVFAMMPATHVGHEGGWCTVANGGMAVGLSARSTSVQGILVSARRTVSWM